MTVEEPEPERFHQQYEVDTPTPEEAVADVRCPDCDVSVDIQTRDILGPVVLFALSCPECGRTFHAEVEALTHLG